MPLDALDATAFRDLGGALPPPGPTTAWWTQLGQVRRDFLGFLTSNAERYGDIFCIKPAPTTRIFVLNSAELAQEVLGARATEFTKSAQTRFMVGKFLGNGLVLSEGAEHAAQRRLLQPGFTQKSIATITPFIIEQVKAVIDAHSASPLDVEPAMTRLSMNIILRFLIGDGDERPRTSSSISHDKDPFRGLAEAIGGRFRSMPLPSWVPTPRNFRERRAVAHVDRLINEFLNASRQHGHSGKGLLASLGRALDAHTLSFTDVRDQMATLIFAGHETVAKSLSWTLYLLAREQGIQDELRSEIMALAADRDLEAADMPRLKRTANVVKESLRLYPPVWVFDRSPIEPLQLGRQNVGPKDVVYVSPYLLHRQERYFRHPHTFDPSRFEAPNIVNATAYIPFGAGSRGCVGQSLAFLETMLAVATIIKHRRLVPAFSSAVLPRPEATLSPAAPILITLVNWL